MNKKLPKYKPMKDGDHIYTAFTCKGTDIAALISFCKNMLSVNYKIPLMKTLVIAHLKDTLFYDEFMDYVEFMGSNIKGNVPDENNER